LCDIAWTRPQASLYRGQSSIMTRAGSLRSSWHSEKLRDHHCIVQHLTDITAVTDNYKEI